MIVKNIIYIYLKENRAKYNVYNVKIVDAEPIPVKVNNKVEILYLEVDTVFGAKQKLFLLTIVNKIPNKCADNVVENFKSIFCSTNQVFLQFLKIG